MPQTQLLNPAHPIHNHRFLQVVVNPLKNWPFGGYNCWITHHDAVPLPDPIPFAGPDQRNWRGRAQRGGAQAGMNISIDDKPGDFFDTLCSTGNVQDLLKKISSWLRAGEFVFLPPLGGPVIPGIPGTGLFLLAADIIDGVLRRVTSSRLGDFITEICNDAISNNLPFLIQAMNGITLGFGQGAEPIGEPLTDVYYAILDRFNYADRNCIVNGDSIEIAFDASAGAHVNFVNGTLLPMASDLIEGQLTGRPEAFGGYASMRFTSATNALIGIQKWRRTCIIEVAGLKHLSGMADFLDALEQKAKLAGATVHWGQRNHLLRSEVDAMYPLINRWRSWLKTFSSGGPLNQFSTLYSQRAGLEL